MKSREIQKVLHLCEDPPGPVLGTLTPQFRTSVPRGASRQRLSPTLTILKPLGGAASGDDDFLPKIY